MQTIINMRKKKICSPIRPYVLYFCENLYVKSKAVSRQQNKKKVEKKNNEKKNVVTNKNIHPQTQHLINIYEYNMYKITSLKSTNTSNAKSHKTKKRHLKHVNAIKKKIREKRTEKFV